LGKTRSVSNFLILVLIVLLVAFALVKSLPFILNTQHPIEVVQGTSMQNTYFEGDLVILGGFPAQNIQVGDVVGYQATGYPSSGLIVIHRVIGIVAGNDGTILSFIIQGDNQVTNPFPDIPVPPSLIVGKVLFHVPAWLARTVYPVVLTLQEPFFPVLPLGLIVIILLLRVVK